MTKPHNQMTFFEHLGELRKRILYSLAFVLVFFMGAFNFSSTLFNWLAQPVIKFLPSREGETAKLAFTALSEPFMMYIKVAFIAAIFISAPFIFHQLWLFISPGLYKKEKKYVFPFIFFSSLFFISGGAFGYYVIFPFACRFFLQIGSSFTAIITINQYFSLAFRLILGIALIFELPVLVFLLSKLRIISARFLIKYFKYAIIVIFIIAAIITPTPDMITQSLFAGPMILLYLLSILIAKIFGPKSEEKKDK